MNTLTRRLAALVAALALAATAAGCANTPTVDIVHTTSNGSDNITGTATTVFASLTHQTTLTLP